MDDLSISMSANNSSGKQRLYLQEDDDLYFFTLCGVYREKDIQIDFDELTRNDLIEIKTMIDLILEVKGK